MKGSLKIGTLFGIGVYLHFTFLMLLVFIGWAEYTASGSIGEVAYTLGFLVALFICLVMHEYGHALTARRFGIKTQDITLLPIGGIARLERMPEKPWQEFMVAVMGPMVNVVIAAILLGGLAISYTWTDVSVAVFPLMGMTGNFWLDLAKVNVLLILFNMLPAFPMDGGRVVRALLAMVLPYERATSIAAVMGRFMAVLFLMEALGMNTLPFLDGSGNFLLGFIAIFIWIGAGSEARFVLLKARLKDVPVSQAMVSNFRTLSPRDTVEWAAELAASGMQQDFPVADEGRVVGMVFQQDLAAAARREEPYLRIGDVMRKNVPTVLSTAPLHEVIMTVLGSGLPIVPVTNRDLLVGLLPLERLMRRPPGGGATSPGQTRQLKLPQWRGR